MPPKKAAIVAKGDSPQSATPSQRREWRLKDQHGSLSDVESPEKVSAKRTSETNVEETETTAKKARPAESPEKAMPAGADSPDAPEAKRARLAGADSPDGRTDFSDVFDKIEAAAGSQQPAGANSPAALAEPLMVEHREDVKIQKRSGVVVEQSTVA